MPDLRDTLANLQQGLLKGAAHSDDGSAAGSAASVAAQDAREKGSARSKASTTKRASTARTVSTAGTAGVAGSGAAAAAKKARSDRRAVGVELMQIPLWPDQARGIPNSFARSALFSVGKHNDARETFKAKAIATIGDATLTYTGEELRQLDQDVLMQLIHMARSQPLDQPIVFRAHSMLRSLRWGVAAANYKRLKESISRMQGTSVRVQARKGEGTVGFQGALVRMFGWNETEADGFQWSVLLEPSIVELFDSDEYTLVMWRQRVRLRSPLSKWLHSYLATHERPYPIRLETLHGLCGSKMARVRDFKKVLVDSLDGLVEIGFLRSFDVVDGLVSVVRVPKAEMLKDPEIMSLDPVFKHSKAALQDDERIVEMG